MSVSLKGRTGPNRAKLHATIVWNESMDSYIVRVDDEANLEFWLEIVIPDSLLIKNE
jgi:hypothetical protein